MAETNDNKKILEVDHGQKNFVLKVSINGVDVEPLTIENITIREWIFDKLPRLELSFVDAGRFVDQYPLQDNDEIKITLNNFNDEDPVIEAKFDLQDYVIKNMGRSQRSQVSIEITGLLKTDEFTFPLKSRAFKGKNSSEVCDKISQEAGLKFESRVTPADSMNWLQINSSNIDMLSHVTQRAYVKKDDMTFIYVDRDGTLVYTSLNTETGKEDVKLAKFNLEKSSLNSALFTSDALEKIKKNDAEQYKSKTDIVYFNNFFYNNVAGTFNKKNSYGYRFFYNDMDVSKKKILDFDEHPLSDNSLKEKDNIGKIVSNKINGFLDTDNVFEHYFTSLGQNEYIRDNFFSSCLVIYTGPRNTLKLFDKVNVELPTTSPIESDLDEVHSGNYIVGGIIHEASKNSIYNTIVILFRNGLNVKGFKKEFETRHSGKGSTGG